MSDASVSVIDGRAVVRVGGAELLDPIVRQAEKARDAVRPLSGIGAPAAGLGNVGQVYYDVADPTNPILYGPKDANGWGPARPLRGPASGPLTTDSVGAGELKSASASLLAILSKLLFKARGLLGRFRSLLGKLRDSVNVFDFIPEELHEDILARTASDDIAKGKLLAGYIQDAIDAAAGQRRRLVVPAGLYNLAPAATFTAEGGTCNCCFAIRSYMDIDAESGATFRIIDEVSTDSAPVFMCMFGTNEILTRVSWRGLEMDMNGPNNLFSATRNNPALPNNGYSLLNQAQIYISGTPGGQAARINGALVEYCRFLNTPGVSCLVMGQSNVVGSGVGRGWKVLYCEFRNGGLDTVDHSAVYAWAEDVIGVGNTFENDTQFGPTGGLVAWEVHGSNQVFAHNTIRRFYQMLWIDGNATNPTKNIRICYNLGEEMKAYGIMYFGRIEAEESVTDTTVSFNEINLDGSDLDGEDLKIGIGCTGPYSQTNARIVSNRVRGAASPVASAGVVIAAGIVLNEKHDRFLVADNVFENVSLGVSLSTNANVGLGAIVLRNNESVNLRVAGIIGFTQGISYSGGGSQIDSLALEYNRCHDDRTGTQTAFGIRLQGAVGELTKVGNTARGMTAANYAEVGFLAASRIGIFDTSIAYNPGVLAPGATTFADVNLPNALMGDKVEATMNVDMGEVVLTCAMTSPGVARARFRNLGSGSFTGISGTLRVTLDRQP